MFTDSILVIKCYQVNYGKQAVYAHWINDLCIGCKKTLAEFIGRDIANQQSCAKMY